MRKIRKIKYINHEILGNLELDFCDEFGNSVDTVIIAGENGTGKSTILNTLYKFSSNEIDFEANIELEDGSKVFNLYYRYKDDLLYCYKSLTSTRNSMFVRSSIYVNEFNFKGIFSDVNINFESRELSNVTSLTLDSDDNSVKSSSNMATSIKQLIIDIQSQDDAEISYAYRTAAKDKLDLNNVKYEERMTRFKNAFSYIFDEITYDSIQSTGTSKSIIFKKNNKEIPIDNLSSGEKQIVYRGSFLLKDKDSLNGAFVFIDEPEISMHPLWQTKIMNYYKNIFIDNSGNQTSQIFAVTHSPFVIHNEHRSNDIVIVLKNEKNGNINAYQEPKFIFGSGYKTVDKAFNIRKFFEISNDNEQVVYLEGRTDEKYFNRAIEVFGIQTEIKFKWIGYVGEDGNEYNTGSSSLKHGINFKKAQNNKNVCMFLFDSDEKLKVEFERNKNIITKKIPFFVNSENINRGIENVLILDNVPLKTFYTEKTEVTPYQEIKTFQTLEKMKLCEYICGLNEEDGKLVLKNFKDIIEDIIIDFKKRT